MHSLLTQKKTLDSNHYEEITTTGNFNKIKTSHLVNKLHENVLKSTKTCRLHTRLHLRAKKERKEKLSEILRKKENILHRKKQNIIRNTILRRNFTFIMLKVMTRKVLKSNYQFTASVREMNLD